MVVIQGLCKLSTINVRSLILLSLTCIQDTKLGVGYPMTEVMVNLPLILRVSLTRIVISNVVSTACQ